MLRITCLVLLSALAPVAGAAEPAPVDFSRDVLPVLSDYCFQCHGPDANARKAKLRLDDKNSPFDRGVIVPGKPKDSALVERITSTDPDVVMPPPSLKRMLSAQQIAALTRWVEQGAKWSTHWAFDPMTKPEVPTGLKDQQWAKNPIDAFVLARLAREGLNPAAAADKERLLRRVTLRPDRPAADRRRDRRVPERRRRRTRTRRSSTGCSPRRVTASGWPPTGSTSPASPTRTATRWTATRPMWPYRDWVIKAFNQNLPFDQFVTWQLAGDLLPNATKEQRLATAFNRLHMQNEEGGIVEEEFRVAYVVDRVTTFGTAFLGLTFECSRCHDHKFDPITQKDFYSLFAFFQNIDESRPDVATSPRRCRCRRCCSRTDEPGREAGRTTNRRSGRSETHWRRAAWTRRPSSRSGSGRRSSTCRGWSAAYSFDDIKAGKVDERRRRQDTRQAPSKDRSWCPASSARPPS